MSKTFASDYAATNGRIYVSCSELFTFNLTQYFEDADDDSLTYSITRFNGSALPNWLGVSSGFVMSGKPKTNQGEILNMLVSVSDGKGSKLNVPLEFYVGCPPKDTGRMQDTLYLTSGQQFIYNFVYSFEDLNQGSITYKFTGPSWIGISGTIMNAQPTDPGSFYGTLYVCDRFASCLRKNLTFVVKPINGPPIFRKAIPDQYVYTRVPFVFKVPEGTFEDLSGGAMFFSARSVVTQ